MKTKGSPAKHVPLPQGDTALSSDISPITLGGTPDRLAWAHPQWTVWHWQVKPPVNLGLPIWKQGSYLRGVKWIIVDGTPAQSSTEEVLSFLPPSVLLGLCFQRFERIYHQKHDNLTISMHRTSFQNVGHGWHWESLYKVGSAGFVEWLDWEIFQPRQHSV